MEGRTIFDRRRVRHPCHSCRAHCARARACVVVSFLTQHSSGSELSQPDQNFFAHISNVCGHSSISLHWSFSLASVVHYGRVVRHDDGGVFRRSLVGSPVRSISSASTVITTTEPRESEEERERERERERLGERRDRCSN